MENAKRHKASGFGRVDTADVDQVKAHLLQGSAVIVTMFITENFVNLDDRYWKQPAGRAVGKQTVVVVGYNDRDFTFQILNSAGPDWGHGGYAYIPYRWFVRLVTQGYVIW
jgi:C1A family cysteine protease